MPHISLVRRAARAALPLLGLTLASLLPTGAASAQPAAPTLLINTHPAGLDVYGGLHYQGAIWQGVTTALGTTFGGRIAQSQNLLDGAALLGYDALWIDQRWHHTPQAAEIANLQAFVQTGRRVVLVGENASWGGWNAALLTMLGGQEGPLAGRLPNEGGSPGLGCQDGLTDRAVDHMLTRGVGQIRMACGGYAIGGTSLFGYGVATLWGAQQNVLTILDANVLDDVWYQGSNNRQFQANVVAWAAGAEASAAVVLTTPEPGTWALLGTGLLAVGGLAVRRRKA